MRAYRSDAQMTLTSQSINQSVNQSCIFRVVQVTKSLQDPLEVGNNLLGIDDNVRERGPRNRNVLNADGRLTERRGRYHVVRQAVPDGGSGDWECPAADGRQLAKRRNHCN